MNQQRQSEQQRDLPENGQGAEHAPQGTNSEERVMAEAEQDRERQPENEAGDPMPLEQPAEG